MVSPNIWSIPRYGTVRHSCLCEINDLHIFSSSTKVPLCLLICLLHLGHPTATNRGPEVIFTLPESPAWVCWRLRALKPMIQRLLSFAQKTIESCSALPEFVQSDLSLGSTGFSEINLFDRLHMDCSGLLVDTRCRWVLSSEQLVPEIRKDWFTQAELRLAKRFSQLGLFGVILGHSIIASKINHKP